MIQQGKIQDICVMSEEEKLRLLQQVAGTTVYDQKKTESLAKMQENESSIAKIQEILSDLSDRLDELQAEKDELADYQKLDRQRRALQYTLYDKEWKKARHVLEALEESRSEHADEIAKHHDICKKTHDDIHTKNSQVQALTHQLRRRQLETQAIVDDKSAAVARFTELSVQVAELEESVRQGSQTLKQNQDELRNLDNNIEATIKQLETNEKPKYDAALKQQKELISERDQAQHEIDSLYAKQGRGQHFRNKAERDNFIKSAIADLEQQATEKESALNEQQDALSSLRRVLDQDKKDLAKHDAEVKQMESNLQLLSKQLVEKKHERIRLQDEKKEAWRKTEVLRDKLRESRHNMHSAFSELKKTMPRATALGLESLENVVDREGIIRGKEYFGMLLENMTLRDPKFQTAVEVAAQNSLFHVIVDTDTTASKLMKILEDGRLGRVTFLPLNQLRVDRFQYPENTSDVVPLLAQCVQYDEKVEIAMSHVFNKKLLARSPEVASEWSTKLGVDAITLDGDLCSRKGALTGGYVDSNKSRIRAFTRQKEARVLLQKVEADYEETNRKSQTAEQRATDLMQEVQRIEARHAEISNRISEKESEIDRLQARYSNQQKTIEQIEREIIPNLESEKTTIASDIKGFRDELGTDLSSVLSTVDRERLDQIKLRLEELSSDIQSQADIVSQSSLACQKLQSLLDDNLMKRRNEILQILAGEKTARRGSRSRDSSTGVLEKRKQALEDLKLDLAEATTSKEELEKRLEEARSNVEDIVAQINSGKSQLEKLREKDMDNVKRLEELQEFGENLLNKRSMSISARESNMRKIQELGSLPPVDELEKFSKKSIKEASKILEDVNKKLKKFSHVNKKALDQYVQFNEQRESLLKRKEELDLEAGKVQDLIANLDRKKDEAINRTFRGVSVHFKEVFKELVPHGAGEIVMRTAMDDAHANEVDDDTKKPDDPSNPNVSLFRGILINVRFSEVGENYQMSQLSGGQKALVALALIFAIQRCDPAPFYIFDELDQALDSAYRASVADLIQRQSRSEDNPAQFIVSTFRPELVSAADNWYGISLQNKVSNVHSLTKTEALSFIANLMSEEEAVGDVTTLASSKASRRSTLSRKRKLLADDGVVSEEPSISSAIEP